MVAPSRPTKILFGVAAALVVAGFLVVIIIANLDHSRPIPLPLLIIVIALVGSGGLIVGCLALAAFLRQSKPRRPEGWPPG
jgi:dipeptide/tripeptide permease